MRYPQRLTLIYVCDFYTKPAPMSEARIMYIVKKAMAPRVSSVQLGSRSCVRMKCVAEAEKMEAESIFVEDIQSIIAP